MIPRRRLIGGDFTEPPAPKRQAIALVFGQPGCGKTTFGLVHAPGPIAFFDVDRRGAWAARRAVHKGKVINYLPVLSPQKVLKMSDNDLKKMAEQEVSKVRRNYELAIREAERGNLKTIVLDTMTEFASLVNMAVTGRADRKKDDYGRSVDIIKTILADLIRMCRGTPANLLMLAKAKPVWEGGEPTGEYEFRGPDILVYDADWAGHLRLANQRRIRQRRGAEGQKHELQITKAGIRLKTLGAVYTQEDWKSAGPFVWACMEQYRGTSEKDWS